MIYRKRREVFFLKGLCRISIFEFKTGISIKFQNSAIIKKHSGNGIIAINSSVGYDERSWDNVVIITDPLYQFTGIGLKIQKHQGLK